MAAPTLTLTQRLDMIPAMLSVAAAGIATALYGPFRGTEGAATFDRHMQNGITRRLAGRLNIAQLQFVRGTSTATFDKWAAANPSVEVHTDVIGDDAKVHWLGNKDADKVLLHVHGGGYILPLSVGHLALLNGLREAIHASTGVNMSVAIVEYTLAPIKPYPTQVRQANAALHHIIGLGVSPSNVILSGDSAGAHVILCLLSHILHPHPDIAAPPTLSAPLAGLLLISPRVSNATTAPSFTQNTARDTLTRETFVSWIANFRANSSITSEDGLAKDGWYTEPVNAPTEWWDALAGTVVKRVFVSAGEHECMRDDIVRFGLKWKDEVKGLDVQLEVEEKGIHDSPLMDVGRAPSALMVSIGTWLGKTAKGDA
ncbi:Alpha/Beta hydrolase protein [Amylostereum chailletii]|nr:Alpha/Beta hydrolase protein [Amylostereum chailletii]